MTTDHLRIPDDLEEHLGRLGAEVDRRRAALDDEDNSSAKRQRNVARGASTLIQREQDAAVARDEERDQLEAIKARADRMLQVATDHSDGDDSDEGDTSDDEPTDVADGDDGDGDTPDPDPTTPMDPPPPTPPTDEDDPAPAPADTGDSDDSDDTPWYRPQPAWLWLIVALIVTLVFFGIGVSTSDFVSGGGGSVQLPNWVMVVLTIIYVGGVTLLGWFLGAALGQAIQTRFDNRGNEDE